MKVLGGAQCVQYGTTAIHYELVYSERKTLAIHVYPDGSIEVDAPVGSPLADVSAKVLKRAAWILRQQREFARYAPTNPLPRRYVSGESYRYLGRQYRLKVVEDTVQRVQLSRGWLTVSIPDPADKSRIAELIDRWYRGHARRVFNDRLLACFPRVESLGVELPTLAVRAMKNRWGSCSASQRVTLNLKLIQVPKDLIDYVILHELCHLKEPNHSSAFYALLTRILPDWRERKDRLNRLELEAE